MIVSEGACRCHGKLFCKGALRGYCQVRVYSGRGSGQVQMKADEGQGQGAGQEVSPARVGDRLDSMTTLGTSLNEFTRSFDMVSLHE